MSPAYIYSSLLAAMILTVPAASLAISVAGTRLVRRRVNGVPVRDDASGSLAELYQSGWVSPRDVVALSARERALLVRTLGGRATPGPAAMPAPTSAHVEQEVAVATFILVCPACGAALGNTADVAHFVGSCPSCSRRIASRRRGSRVSLSMVEPVQKAEWPGRS